MKIARINTMRWPALAAFSLVALTEAVAAGEFTSVYTSINFDKDCKIVAESEEGASITLRCRGYKGIAINYTEGDLRAAVTFGDQPPGYDAPWQSFGPWNRINTAVEWRLENSKPIAAILRWFIDNIGPETGAADPKRAGNILVISKLASRDGSPGCMVGLIDARANRAPNDLARNVSDTLTTPFDCRRDKPRYHSKRGPYVPDPT